MAFPFVFSLLLLTLRCGFAYPAQPKHELAGAGHRADIDYRVAVLEETMERLTTNGNIKCGLPPSVCGTDVVYTSTHLNGVAKYTCKEGYVVEGSDLSLCTNKGVWSPIVKKCCNVSETVARWFGRMVYSGNVASTETGKTCQRWKDQSPHKHNFQDFTLINPSGIETLNDIAKITVATHQTVGICGASQPTQTHAGSNVASLCVDMVTSHLLYWTKIVKGHMQPKNRIYR